MADQFQIIPYKVRSAGTDVPPEEIQTAINSLASQTQNALNTIGSDPTGPAGGDLSGNYPNPTVSAVHATSGTISGVAGSFTTLSASTPVAVTSGGTGVNALNAHNVIIGEGSSSVGFAAPGASGGMLISTGASSDPAFGNTVSTLTATGAITPSQTAGIVGTTTNNNANAGSVGEFISANVAGGSAVALTTGTPANITSISLTAGDWDVWGLVAYVANAATVVSQFVGWTSTTSATLPGAPNGGSYFAIFPIGTAGTNNQSFPAGMQRLLLSATTTVYLSTQCSFATNTLSAYGFIGARRVR